MSKLTDQLDAVEAASHPELACVVVHPDPNVRAELSKKLRAGALAREVADGLSPQGVIVEPKGPAWATYRGHDCWLVGEPVPTLTLSLLEEYALSDESEPRRLALIKAAEQVARSLGEGDSGELESLLDQVDAAAASDRSTPPSPETPSGGWLVVDTRGNVAVGPAEGSTAVVVRTSGAPSFAAWSTQPLRTLSDWIDRGVPSDDAWSR